MNLGLIFNLFKSKFDFSPKIYRGVVRNYEVQEEIAFTLNITYLLD